MAVASTFQFWLKKLSAKYGVLCVKKRWITKFMRSKACLKLVGKYGDKSGDFWELLGIIELMRIW